MKVLQLHEYVEFLHAGVQGYLPTIDEGQVATYRAQQWWTETGLAAWETQQRSVVRGWRSLDGKHIGVHITADHKDCFYIAVLSLPDLGEVGCILFDIGAEYRKPIYICPAAGIEAPADRKEIERSMPALGLSGQEFAVLDLGDGTYMQTCRQSDGSFTLEHQLVTTKFHYTVATKLTEKEVVVAFLSYAFGKKEWATDHTWQRVAI